MRKILACLITAVLLLSLCSCGAKQQDTSEDTVSPEVPSGESEVNGTVHDFGRFRALVPEGWEVADLGGYQADYNGIIVKGKADEFMEATSVSILYGLPSELFVSNRGFYEIVRDEGEFDLGGHHWEGWSSSMEGMSVVTAESYGDDGSIFVFVNMPSEDSEKLDLKDPDVRAILESIVVVPTVEVEWIRMEDGKAVALLPEEEGYFWEEGGCMYTNELEVSTELDGNRLIITPESGSGAFSIDLTLNNEEGTFRMGEAKVSIRVTDAKADAVYEGVCSVYDEPEEIEDESWEDDTDYEALAQMYAGIWVDDKNDLTLFIQEDEETEHGCLIRLQQSDKQFSAAGVIEFTQVLMYDEISIDGVTMDSSGYFTFDGDLLIWGHDDAVGDFEYVTIFSRVE